MDKAPLHLLGLFPPLFLDVGIPTYWEEQTGARTQEEFCTPWGPELLCESRSRLSCSTVVCSESEGLPWRGTNWARSLPGRQSPLYINLSTDPGRLEKGSWRDLWPRPGRTDSAKRLRAVREGALRKESSLLSSRPESLAHSVASGTAPPPPLRRESMISKHQLPELLRDQTREDAVLFLPQTWGEVDGDRMPGQGRAERRRTRDPKGLGRVLRRRGRGGGLRHASL